MCARTTCRRRRTFGAAGGRCRHPSTLPPPPPLPPPLPLPLPLTPTLALTRFSQEELGAAPDYRAYVTELEEVRRESALTLTQTLTLT